ncbi:hypothetical protein JCM5296_005488 [Sporobolomyces johnsonii]
MSLPPLPYDVLFQIFLFLDPSPSSPQSLRLAPTSTLQARRRAGQVISLLSRDWRDYGTELYWRAVVIGCHKRDEARRRLELLRSEPRVAQRVRQILIVCTPHDVRTVLGWGSVGPTLLQKLHRLDSVEIEAPHQLTAAVFGGHTTFPASVQLPALSHLSLDTACRVTHTLPFPISAVLCQLPSLKTLRLRQHLSGGARPVPLPPPLPFPCFPQLERLHFELTDASEAHADALLDVVLSMVVLSTLRHLDVTIAWLDPSFFDSLSKCANLQTLRCCTSPDTMVLCVGDFSQVLDSVGVDTLRTLALDITGVDSSPPFDGPFFHIDPDELDRLFDSLATHSALRTVALGFSLSEHQAALETFLASMKEAELVEFRYVTWEEARQERLGVRYTKRIVPEEDGGGMRWEREEDGV